MELFPRQDMTLKKMFESNTVSRHYDDLESTLVQNTTRRGDPRLRRFPLKIKNVTRVQIWTIIGSYDVIQMACRRNALTSFRFEDFCSCR